MIDLIGRAIFIVSSCAFVWYQMYKKDKEIEKLKKELEENRVSLIQANELVSENSKKLFLLAQANKQIAKMQESYNLLAKKHEED